MRFTLLLLSISLSVAYGPVAVNAQEPTPEGVWLHDNKRIRVAIAPCGHELCGKIVWLRNADDADGDALLDARNPDRTRRDQPVVGTTVLHGLVRDGPGQWTGGTIYNPDDGKTYSARIEVVDPDTLHVRVYVLVPPLGETKVWTRVGSDEP